MGAGLLLSADLDFMIKGIFSFELFGQTVWITTSHVCLLIVVLSIIVLSLIANGTMKKAKEIPEGFQNVLELGIDALDGMIKSTMGKHAPGFLNYIGTIFVFILISNLSGLLGLRAPTADYGVTFPMGVLSFTLIFIQKLRYQKVSGFIKGLCDPWPFWAPINVIGDLAVPISLSLRLFANVLSGTIMLALIYGLLGWIATIWPAVLHAYFDVFSGAIQTYVFCMLTMTYIASAMDTD